MLLPPFHVDLEDLPSKIAEPPWLERPSILAEIPDPGAMAWTVARAASLTGELAVIWWNGLQGRPGGVYEARVLTGGSGGDGAPFRLSGDLELCLGRPGLDSLEGGSFLAAWVCRDPSEDGWVLLTRRLTAAGASGLRPSRLTFFEGTELRDPVLVSGIEGTALVLWRSIDGGSGEGTLHGQVVDGWGEALGAPHELGKGWPAARSGAGAAALPGGGYIVSWVSGDDVLVQRLEADGEPIGEPTKVTDKTRASPETPSVAMSGDGRALIGWSGRATSSLNGSLFTCWIDLSGGGSSAEVQISGAEGAGSRARRPAQLAVGPAGEVLAVWRAQVGGGEGGGIFGRWFEGATGLPLEQAFRLDDGRGGEWPYLGRWSERGLVVSWLRDTGADALPGPATVHDLIARLILPRRPGSLPRTAGEVACEGARLRDIVEEVKVAGEFREEVRVVAATMSGALQGVAVARVSRTDKPERGGAQRAERSLGWSLEDSGAFLFEETDHGEVLWRSAEEGGQGTPGLAQRKLGRPSGISSESAQGKPESRDTPGSLAVRAPCHGKWTNRDEILAMGLLSALRPVGPAGEYGLTVFRSQGVDSFWVDVLAQYEGRSFTEHLGVSARFQWDGAGQLRSLELSVQPACAEGQVTGCTDTDARIGVSVLRCSEREEACQVLATLRAKSRGVVRIPLDSR